MTEVVEVDGLVRRYGAKVALDHVTLDVPRGCVFGLLGESGAGKTTLIKHLLGLLRPDEGNVRVLGMDPVANPVSVLALIGYLSEDRDMPRWMRISELMRYTRAFYPKWDPEFAEHLCDTFGLDPAQKISTLSRGQMAKTGLLTALAHRPELLVLDEPSSGLDAVVRKHILNAVMRTAAEEGRTVLFSSHLLHEVERVSDYVAIIHGGKLLLSDRLDRIQSAHHFFEVEFDDALESPPSFEGALSCEGQGRSWTLVCDGGADDLRAEIAAMNARIVRDGAASLEQIFVAHIGAKTLG